MKQIEDVLISLGPERTKGCGHLPIPSEIDDEVRELVQYLGGAAPAERDAVFSIMTQQHGFVLLGFARRMAALAVRTGNPEYVREGLKANAFGSNILDSREAVLVLGPLYHSLVKLGMEPVGYFAEAAGLGEEWFDWQFRAFCDRDEEDRRLEVMGFIESSDDDGFLYQRKRYTG